MMVMLFFKLDAWWLLHVFGCDERHRNFVNTLEGQVKIDGGENIFQFGCTVAMP